MIKARLVAPVNGAMVGRVTNLGRCHRLISPRFREKVERFDTFTPGNDPHQEHDSGAFEHNGDRIFWKLDYYDRTLTKGSEDPSDSAQTTRVLTIMLASEY